MISGEFLSKRDLRRLLDLKTKPLGGKVANTGIMARFHEDHKVGKRVGRILNLERSDITKIREICLSNMSFDIFKDKMPEDRVGTAKLIVNEKAVNTPVKRDVVSFYSSTGELKINGSTFKTPDDVHQNIEFTKLVSVEHASIVLVENYEAFISFRYMKYCNTLTDALIIYRGDSGGRVLSDEVSARFNNSIIYGWFDHDPSGLTLAKASRCHKVIIPDISDDEFRRLGRRALFEKQIRFLGGIKSSYPDGVVSQVERCQTGITQESMIAHDLKLKICDLIM